MTHARADRNHRCAATCRRHLPPPPIAAAMSWHVSLACTRMCRIIGQFKDGTMSVAGSPPTSGDGMDHDMDADDDDDEGPLSLYCCVMCHSDASASSNDEYSTVYYTMHDQNGASSHEHMGHWVTRSQVPHMGAAHCRQHAVCTRQVTPHWQQVSGASVTT